jgi:hypothetical protein
MRVFDLNMSFMRLAVGTFLLRRRVGPKTIPKLEAGYKVLKNELLWDFLPFCLPDLEH